jgi:hypothetical protein
LRSRFISCFCSRFCSLFSCFVIFPAGAIGESTALGEAVDPALGDGEAASLGALKSLPVDPFDGSTVADGDVDGIGSTLRG